MKGKRKKFIAGGVLLVILAVGAAVGVKSYQDKMKNRLWSSKWEDSFCNLHNNNYMATASCMSRTAISDFVIMPPGRMI